jgi:hypothetical protein
MYSDGVASSKAGHGLADGTFRAHALIDFFDLGGSWKRSLILERFKVKVPRLVQSSQNRDPARPSYPAKNNRPTS